MPTKKYSLEKNGPLRLEISWKEFWKNMIVRLDGKEIGSIIDRKELEAGREFPMSDGCVLRIQLAQKFMSPELRVLKNGQPLPGSASDPARILKLAFGIIFFIGGLNIILGLIAEILQVESLMQIGFGLGSIIFGALFFILGFFTKRRSKIALSIAVSLYALDGVLSVVFAVQQGGAIPTTGIIIRVFLLIPMIRGFGAIKTLKQ